MKINLPFPPSVNSMYTNMRLKNGRVCRVKSKKYKAWIKAAGSELIAQRPASVRGHISLTIAFGERHRKYGRDISNHIKAVEDLLVKHGVIDDDRFVDWLVVFWDGNTDDVAVTIIKA